MDGLNKRKTKTIEWNTFHKSKGHRSHLTIIDIHGLEINEEDFPEDNVFYFYQIWLPLIKEQMILPESAGGDFDYFNDLLNDAIFFDIEMIDYAIEKLTLEFIDEISIEGLDFTLSEFIKMITKYVSLFHMPNIFKFGTMDGWLALEQKTREQESWNNLVKRMTLAKIKAKNTKGYVYLFQTKYGTKIGKTLSPKKRIKDIETFLPFPVLKFEYFYVEKYSHVEKYFHKRFSNKKIKGEWFSLSKKDIEDIKNEIKQFKPTNKQ